jgi:hypothetical protein
MEIKRRFQLGSAAVIANGLLALTALSPSPALANPCTGQVIPCSCHNLAYCQSIAKPGCTATSVVCTNLFPPICGSNGIITICHYD